ncbi:hypothetical protein Pla163_08710 [Planctomycetes bacterium Pla163]|uniref:Methyltransferase domain-containing protein n=1 Tax=Rohdeia mirabilis TaxID=2528008 RepID=A0A518CX18_9BACT|nr:hypothetical protein Pla163_08710 [Planctomycetes bacterium Pla163]
MRRLHLFEWEDQFWFPATLRDLMTDYLRFVVALFKMSAPVVPLLDRLLTETGSTRIVDLASGGGGPWGTLAPALRESHPDLRVTLTDRYPNLSALRVAAASAPEVIEIRTEPVDALDVPDDLDGVRTQFLSLHHFRPDQVRAIFANAVAAGRPIAVFEFQQRDLAHLIRFALSPVFVLLLSWAIRPFSLRRILFTYLIPVVPLLIMWDGVVSVLRTYTPDELERIVASVPGAAGYDWDVGAATEGQASVVRAIGRPRMV